MPQNMETTAPGAEDRLFIALWPTPAIRRALCAEQSRWLWPPGAAVTPADKLHLTLHFIGNVPALRVPEVIQGLNVAVPRLALTLDTSECWPNRCAVLSPSRWPASLAALHGALAHALRALALPVEPRPWRPHVTLARRAAGAAPPAQPPSLHWPVHGFVLVRSRAGRYSPIARYK
jgi:2'-5' RNA ligase